MDFSIRIKEYRKKHYLTQEEFAKLIGSTLITVSRWETGKFEPTMKMKKKLHELFEKDKRSENND